MSTVIKLCFSLKNISVMMLSTDSLSLSK